MDIVNYIKVIMLIVTFGTVEMAPSIERCNRIIRKCPRRLNSGEVCGSDGRTYTNECKLLRKSCKKQRNLRKTHDGACGPSDDVIHYTYEVYKPYQTNRDDSDSEEDVWPKILVKFDNKYAIPNRIPSNVITEPHFKKERNKGNERKRQRKRKNRINRRKNSSSSSLEDLEDQRRYDTDSVETRHRKSKTNKRRRNNIQPVRTTIKPNIFTENLIPIAPTEFAQQTTMHIEEKGLTIQTAAPTELVTPPNNCRLYCSPFLPKAPFCGTNGKTYSSLCEMEQDACKRRDPTITVIYDGPCIQAEERTTCPQYCPLVFKPVCGSDGKTYPSSCWLGAVSCTHATQGAKLFEAYSGRCKAKIKVKDPERPICKRTCPTEFKRVCGSDGVTYANECLLKIDSCKDPELTVVMQGPCPPK
ncbi:ovoinhibitor-like [Antedon mediterranea]|uniref:ovoinhibitor-like n=1 Tax=Antedon mediterranea TaxID=105859 RepID=UPI003AF976BE